MLTRGALGAAIRNGGGGGIAYLLRDLFATDRAAGAVNGTAAEPGPGTRTITDLDSRITVTGGELAIAAAGTTGDRTAFSHSQTVTRYPGTVLGFNFIQPVAAANTIHFGFAPTQNVNVSAHNDTGLRSLAAGSLYARIGSTVVNPKIAVASGNTQYRIYQVLRAVGQFVFLKTGSTVKFLWADSKDASPTLYFSVWHSGILASRYGSIVAPTPRYSFSASSSDSFNRADGAPGNTDGLGHAEGGSGSGKAWTSNVGTAAIASNVLGFSALSGGVGIATVDTSNTDEFISVEGTRAGGEIGIVTRYVDANNYIHFYHDGTNFKLDKVLAGVRTNLATKALTIAAGGKIKARMDGTAAWGWYDDQDADMEPITIADAALQTGTKHGVYTTDTGNTFNNWYTIPVNGYADLGAI